MERKKLSIEEVARYPRPGMSVPRRFDFTPDAAKVTYLFSSEGTLVQQLWAYDLKNGQRELLTGAGQGGTSEESLSREEELRRERNRVRELGVTDYQFAKEARPLALLVPMGGWLYLKRGDEPLTRLENSQGTQDARFSPDGSKIAFVRDDELYVLDLKSGTLRQLTDGAGGGLTNGLAEYVAQEEMGRAEGYWWNLDSSSLAYIEADSRHIPHYPIAHQGKEIFEIEEHRYPFAGRGNATVRLGVISVEGGETRWLDLGSDPEIYLARVAWRPDGTLAAQIETRDQRTLRLVSFDLQTGKATTLIEEKGDPWINLDDDTRFLKSGEILWSSEKSGYRHLYLHDREGRQIRALTEGEWVVTKLVDVDEGQRVAYFQATKDSVLERHLYSVSLDGGSIQRLTSEPGWHETVLSPDFSRFIDQYSSLEKAPVVALKRIDGSLETMLYEDPAATAENLGLQIPELISFPNRDGITLYGMVYTPPDLEPGKRYPLVVAVYGGPHVQRVSNLWDWTVDLRPQYLAQEGFVVLKLDNRGSANRGLAFEGAIAGDMGNLEVQDQVDGVRFLAQRDYVDGERVGIYGWSYGGYMTAMALVRAPEVFKVGVSGAPVSHWDGYDTHYTERYMRTPETNPEGYRRASIMAHVENLQGKLLLVHGMVDENVHFRHTARLIVALTEAQKPYDLVLYPEERHMPRNAKGLEYMERRIIDYFKQNL
jgi:dipeptidyl-peptidase-4